VTTKRDDSIRQAIYSPLDILWASKISDPQYMSAIGVKCNVLLRALRNVGALLAASLLASCSPLNVLNGLGPDNGYRHVTRVPYGNDARQQMDTY
jgi:hypothetical protein